MVNGSRGLPNVHYEMRVGQGGESEIAARSDVPLVSTIIPVYNGANYVSAAIESALDQTYPNIEVIVVDDGSTDNTSDIVAQFPVKYIKKQNGGVASALNTGAREMKGQFFCWLSHDDVFNRNKIERQVETYLGRPASERIILCSDYELINGAGETYNTVTLDTKMIAEKPEYAVLRGSVNGCTVFIPADFFSEVGYFDESLPYTQDYDLWLRGLQRYRFVHMPEALIKCRQHDQQGSKRGNYAAEFNSLWIKSLDSISPDRARELEGSHAQFFLEMQKFLSQAGANQAAAEAGSRAVESIKVSVIIPFFQNTDQLRAAVNSVLSQTHKNIEVIVVYDTPETNISDAVPGALPAGFTFAHYCQHRRGAGLARNFGVERATGEYIAFLDSDDLFMPTKVDRQLRFMVENHAFISHTSFFAFAANETMYSSIRPSGKFRGRVFPEILSSNPIAMPTAMVRAEVSRKHSFPDAFECEDTLFWASVTEEYELFGIDEVLSIVSVSADSVAYNPVKQWKALLRIIDTLEADSRFRVHTEQLEELRNASDVVLRKLRDDSLLANFASSGDVRAGLEQMRLELAQVRLEVDALTSRLQPLEGDVSHVLQRQTELLSEVRGTQRQNTVNERGFQDIKASVDDIMQSRIWKTLTSVGGFLLRVSGRKAG
jgi:glycosyltransferase involved in cell wall biosynthesis